MIETRTIIANVQGDFEGGNSMPIDWDSLLKRACRTTVRQLRPETLKRTVPVYGGLADGLSIYYCPDNVLVPSRLYTNDRATYFDHIASNVFRETQRTDVYTIEYINGARFLLVKHAVANSGLVIDEMDEVGTKTGGNITKNTQTFLLTGSSLEATFNETGVEVGDNTQLDITEFMRGNIILPAFIPIRDNVKDIEIRLKTDDDNYYTINTTGQKAGEFMVDGWNSLTFNLSNATVVGTPNPANITEWSIIGFTNIGKTATIIFDRFTLQNFAPYFLEFYTDALFVDGTTGEMWKNDVSFQNNDKVFLNRDVENILHYELCLLVTQSSTFDRIDSQATSRFQGQLKREYDAYWAVHPSSEQPVIYNRQPKM